MGENDAGKVTPESVEVEFMERLDGPPRVILHSSPDVSRETFTPCPATLRGEKCELPAGHAHEHESRSYIWDDTAEDRLT